MVRLPARAEQRCQCDWQLEYGGQLGNYTSRIFIPCGQDMTQEDLLCDYCRLNYGKIHGHRLDPGFA
jgi:hypothetical protein